MFAHISNVGVALWDEHFRNVHSSRTRDRKRTREFMCFYPFRIRNSHRRRHTLWLMAHIFKPVLSTTMGDVFVWALCLKWNCGNGYNIIRQHIWKFSIVKMATNKSEPCHQMAFYEILFPLHMLLGVSAQSTRSIANFEWEKKERQINLVESILCLFSSPFCIAFY